MIDSAVKRILEEYQTIFKTDIQPKLIKKSFKRRPYSIVAKLSFSFGKSEKKVYVKIPLTGNTSNIQEEFYMLKYYYEKFNGYHKYGVINPLAYYNDPPMLITEEVFGKVFSLIIGRYAKLYTTNKTLQYLILLSRRCGEWLKIFQSFPPYKSNILYQIDDPVLFICDQLSRCSKNNLIEKNFVNTIHKYIETLASSVSISNVKITAMHSDFILSNILVDKEKIYGLDFSTVKVGPSCRDVSTFLYSLDTLLTNPMYKTSTINILKKEFLAGYGWNINQENLQMFKLFCIREILGGLLQLSMRVQSGHIRYWSFKRIQERSKESIFNIMNDSKIGDEVCLIR